MWYWFKFVFFKKFINIYKRYLYTGMLSSQFVHYIINKNINYHSLIKYNSKNFNLSTCGHNIINSTPQLIDLIVISQCNNTEKVRLIISNHDLRTSNTTLCTFIEPNEDENTRISLFTVNQQLFQTNIKYLYYLYKLLIT